MAPKGSGPQSDSPCAGPEQGSTAATPGSGIRRDEGPSRTVLLPGDEGGLMTREVEEALTAEGYEVLRLPPAPKDLPDLLRSRLRQERPALFCSVNLRGLDAEGSIFHLLQACGVPVAVWLVDNPWHVLSALRQPWWRKALLFVSDPSFVPALRAHGAELVDYLPLAAWSRPYPRRLPAGCPPPTAPLTFVGSSRFPDRDRFFAGVRIADALMDTALSRLMDVDPPHVHWWAKTLGLDVTWPGAAIRSVGLGAETCSATRRGRWLEAARRIGLNLYGDEGWRDYFPDLALFPPVDYYRTLPPIYAASRYTLNVTSLLLPQSLSQRHFDVWMADGFLLSDATPGLALFPEALTAPITVRSPADMDSVLTRFEKDSALKRELAAAWKQCLRAEHSYRHRVQRILDCATAPV